MATTSSGFTGLALTEKDGRVEGINAAQVVGWRFEPAREDEDEPGAMSTHWLEVTLEGGHALVFQGPKALMFAKLLEAVCVPGGHLVNQG